MDNATALQNLKDAVAANTAQVALTNAAIAKLQATAGVAPAEVQAATDALNTSTASLKAATPSV